MNLKEILVQPYPKLYEAVTVSLLSYVCKIICGAPTTLAVKGLMMMMMKLCVKRMKPEKILLDATKCKLWPG